MIRYTAYELRKLIGYRYVILLFLACFIINGLLALYQTRQINGELPDDAISDFMRMYANDREKIYVDYENRQEWNNAQNAIFIEQIQSGNYDYKPETLPNKYAPDEFSDDDLFHELYSRIDYIKTYPDTINSYIARAKSSLMELEYQGASINSYYVQYQKQIISTYTEVLNNTSLKLEYTHGWDSYFSYEAVNIFVFIVLIVVVTAIFLKDGTTGILAIIRTTKNGRNIMALSKISAMAFITIIIVLLFSFETLGIFYMRMIFGNLDNAIQIYDMFTFCPYVITIGTYFLVTLAVKFITFLAFSAVIALINILIRNMVLSFVANMVVVGVNYILYTVQTTYGNSVQKYLNFMSGATINQIFSRYRTLDFFGNSIDYLIVYIIFCVFLFMSLSVYCIFIYSGMRKVRIFRLSNNKLCRIFHEMFKSNSREKNITPKYKLRLHYHAMSLYFIEFYKIIIASRLYILLIILLFIKILNSSETSQAQQTHSDSVYHEYMTILAGEMTDDKRQYIADERQRIDEILLKYDDVLVDYTNGVLSFDEYNAYMKNYNDAYSKNEYFVFIESHATYIDQMAANGREAWFVYDSGWKRIIFASFDIFLYAALIIMFADSVSMEYASTTHKNGFSQILRLCKYGRKRTILHKYLSVATVSALITIILNAVDLIIIAHSYELPLMNAPITSIELCKSFNLQINIMEYIIIMLITRIVSGVLLSLLTVSLSCLFKQSILAISIVAVLTLLPNVTLKLSANLTEYVDYTRFLRATPLLLESKGIIWSTCVLMILFLVITTISVMRWLDET